MNYNPDQNFYRYRRQIPKMSPVNTAIIVANVIVFIAMEFLGSTQSARFMIAHGASYWPLIKFDHEYYRLFTSAFLHFGVQHLVMNMIVLAVIGDNLERAMGKVRYLFFYLLCAVGSGYVSYLVAMRMEENTVSAGASGAIFGVSGGILYVLIANRGRLEDLTAFQIFMFIAFTLYNGMNSSGVDNVAHISWLLIGLVLAMLFYRRPDRNRIWS